VPAAVAIAWGIAAFPVGAETEVVHLAAVRQGSTDRARERTAPVAHRALAEAGEAAADLAAVVDAVVVVEDAGNGAARVIGAM